VNPHYPRIAERASHRCEYCHAPEAVFNFPFEVEHVVPVSRGGTDEDDNRALACRACNLFKSDPVTGPDAGVGREVPLFHPRQHSWEEHFRVEQETGILRGISPVGRATVVTLQMNSPVQLAARRVWMALRLFP
jgi:hypothetical protein